MQGFFIDIFLLVLMKSKDFLITQQRVGIDAGNVARGRTQVPDIDRCFAYRTWNCRINVHVYNIGALPANIKKTG